MASLTPLETMATPTTSAGWSAQCFDHVAIPASSLARSVAWYKNVLGFEDFMQHEPTFIGPDLAFLRQGGVALALLSLPKTEVPLRGSRSQKGHFAMRVDSKGFWHLDKTLPALLLEHRAGSEHSVEIFRDDFSVQLSLFFYDPDGNEVEVTTWDCERDDTCSRFGGIDSTKSIRGGDGATGAREGK